MDTFPHLKASLHNALEKEIETFKAELSRELSSREGLPSSSIPWTLQ